ncbi:hypothetical protein pb186bvf_018328 [Paramecium bursaria]
MKNYKIQSFLSYQKYCCEIIKRNISGKSTRITNECNKTQIKSIKPNQKKPQKFIGFKLVKSKHQLHKILEQQSPSQKLKSKIWIQNQFLQKLKYVKFLNFFQTQNFQVDRTSILQKIRYKKIYFEVILLFIYQMIFQQFLSVSMHNKKNLFGQPVFIIYLLYLFFLESDTQDFFISSSFQKPW